MVKPLAPMAEKLSVNFCFMASIAVLMPTRAIMPKAMIATVIPVRRRLPLIVRKAREKVSMVRMSDPIYNFKQDGPRGIGLPGIYHGIKLIQQHLGEHPDHQHQRR